MAENENVLVDAGFLVALLSRRDLHYRWAVQLAERFPPPWKTCEAALSEAFHLLGAGGAPTLVALLRRGAIVVRFDLEGNLDNLLKFLDKYSDIPASLADANLVRMTEILAHPRILTTDSDFRIYRRNGRQIVPCVIPS